MIGKITLGNTPGGALNYASKGPLVETNVASVDSHEIAVQMRRVMDGRPGIRDTVIHISLSPTALDNEHVTTQDLQDLAREYAQLMDLDLNRHQYVMFVHREMTGRQHLHLMVNRVGLDGGLYNLHQYKIRNRDACRVLEQRHGLEQVTSAPNDDAKLTPGERRKQARTGKPVPRQYIKSAIDARTPECRTLEELQAALARDNVDLEIMTNSGGPYGVRFSTTDETGERVTFTGKQIANNCTIKQLQARLAAGQQQGTGTRIDNEYLQVPDVDGAKLEAEAREYAANRARQQRTLTEHQYRRITQRAGEAIAAAFRRAENDDDEDENQNTRHRPGI